MAREVIEIVIPTDLDDIVDSATRKAMSDTEKTKLIAVEENAAADQTGAEIKAAYEAEANAYTDTKDTKLAGIAENAEVNPADLASLDPVQNAKLVGIADGAEVNPTGAEMQAAIMILGDAERVLVGSEPQTGEKQIYGIHLNAAENLELDVAAEPKA